MDKRIPQIPVPELTRTLIQEYNFETFIEGYSNKLSRSVAESCRISNPAKNNLQSAVPIRSNQV